MEIFLSFIAIFISLIVLGAFFGRRRGRGRARRRNINSQLNRNHLQPNERRQSVGRDNVNRETPRNGNVRSNNTVRSSASSSRGSQQSQTRNRQSNESRQSNSRNHASREAPRDGNKNRSERR